MARNYYKDGLPLAVKDRKEKFAQYNIARDLNKTYYSYQLKDGSGSASGGESGDIGSTLSEVFNRIRLQGDTEIIFNVTKDKGLFPAGRLRGIAKSTSNSPVFATDDEGAVFANAENISLTAKQDIINLSGRDQVRFITENELTIKEPITGDKRNVGKSKDNLLASTSKLSNHISLPNGYIMAYDMTLKEFYLLDDTSIKLISGGLVAEKFDDYYNTPMPFSADDLFDMKEDINVSTSDSLDSKKISFLYRKGTNLILTVLRFYELEQKIDIVGETNITQLSGISPSSTIKPRIIDSKDLSRYIHIKDENKIISISPDFTTTNVLETFRTYEAVGEYKGELMGYSRGKEPEGITSKYDSSKLQLTSYDNEFTKNSFYTTNGFIYKKEIPNVVKINLETGDKVTIGTALAPSFNNEKVIEDSDNIYWINDNLELITVNKYNDNVKTEELTIINNTGFDTDPDLKQWMPKTDEDGVFFGAEMGSGAYLKAGVLDVKNLIFSYYQELNNNASGTKKTFLTTGNNLIVYTSKLNVIGLGTLVYNFGFNVNTRKFNNIGSQSGDEPSSGSGNEAYVIKDGIYLMWVNTEALVAFGSRSVQINEAYVDENNKVDVRIKKTLASEGLFGTYSNVKVVSENIVIFSDSESPSAQLVVSDIDGNTISRYTLGDYFTPNSNNFIGDVNTSYSFAKREFQDKFLGTFIYQDTVQDNRVYYNYNFDSYRNFFEHFDKKDNTLNTHKREFKETSREIEFYECRNLLDKLIWYGNGVLASNFYNNTNVNIATIDLNNQEVGAIADVEIVDGNIAMLWAPYIKAQSEFKPIADAEPYTFSGLAKYDFVSAYNIVQDYSLTIDGLGYNYISKRRDIVGEVDDKLALFGNGQVFWNGQAYLDSSSEVRGGIFFESWSDNLGEEDRSQDTPSDPEVTGQQIFLTRSIRSTPTGAGGVNHYDYDASRVDIPKFKNKDGKYIKPKFLLDAAIKGVNVKYIDIDSEAWVGYNKIEFLDDEEQIVPFNISRVNFDTYENSTDEESLNPDLFNDGLGNQAWNMVHAYPTVSGSTIKWEFTDVTTQRYYDLLKNSLEESGGISAFLETTAIEQLLSTGIPLIGNFASLDIRVQKTLLPNTSYQKFNAGVNVPVITKQRKFSGDFLKAMYAGTIGCQASGNNERDFSTVDGNYGMSAEDNRFFSFTEETVNIPDRRWPYSYSLLVMDSFLQSPIDTPIIGVNPFGSEFWWAAPILNPKLFNEDGSHTEFYLNLKDEMINGGVTWNGTSFTQNFVNNNNGELTTVPKNPDVTTWSNSNTDDTKYLLLVPNTIDEIAAAIKASGDGENPQSYKEIDVVEDGFATGIAPFRVKVPVAEGMYSRLNQDPFLNAQIASDLGLRINSKLRIEFLGEKAPNRFRLNGYGGNIWTFTEYDSNFNLAKDANGDEVIPRDTQSPNASVTPNSSVKDILLSI